MSLRCDRIFFGTLLATLFPLAALALAETGIIDIAQRGIRFSQTSLDIKPGDTVRYHNQDDVTHNLMVLGPDGEPQDEGLQRPGATVTKTFQQTGTFEVRCAIHPKMKMVVKVAR
jgi:plastocyanin